VNEKEFYKLEQLKKTIPGLKVNCFVMGKDAGEYLKKDWLETGVHGYEHSYPPECERDDQEKYINKALVALKKYLPKRFGFRAPGFQITALTYPILKKLGFYFIAHQTRIQPLNGYKFNQNNIINSHIYDDLTKFKELNGIFKFLSEGVN